MTFSTWFRCGLVLVAFVWCSPAAAAGDTHVQKRGAANDSTADEDAREQALELMRKGSEQYKNGNYASARLSFLKSYELRQTFDVACSLAQTNIRLNRTTEALPYYDVCLDSYPLSGDRGRLEKIRGDREEALKSVGTIRVEFGQAGVQVFLREMLIGVTPLNKPIYLEPGVHSLVFKANEHRQMSRAFRIGAGERHVISAEFEELPPPVTETPAEIQEPEVASQPEPAPVEETTKHNWVPAYVLGGVTVATLASSIVLRVVAGGKKDKGKRLHDDLMPGDCDGSESVDMCDELASLTKSQRSFGIASNATMIASGVFAGATLGWVIYELVRLKETKTSTMNMEPLLDVGAQRAWVGLRGQF